MADFAERFAPLSDMAQLSNDERVRNYILSSLNAKNYNAGSSGRSLADMASDWFAPVATVDPNFGALTPSGRPADLLHRAIIGGARDTLEIPERAVRAAETYAQGGGYDPAPFVDAAMLTMGGTSFGAPAGAIGAGPVRKRFYSGDVYGSAGKDAPINASVQTVNEPYRMMYPGIYRNPREIAELANSRVIAEDPALQQLWGVSRRDLEDIGRARGVGTDVPNVTLAAKPKGATSAQNVMTPANEQRLIDVLAEGGKYPGLAHADAWYVMDPVYQRMAQMFGPEEAAARFKKFNTMTGMASPGSDVLTELQRGTAAHWLSGEGRFGDFSSLAGLAEAKRGANFPADMRYIGGHPYHKTSQVAPMEKYLASGELVSDAPKVPSYVMASGVPETGFQTRFPVGDAHYSRGIGLADTRKGPTDVQASWSGSEYQTLSPWWREKVAAPVGIEAVPAQARLWTVLGPQTGVDSPLGQGKLELFSQQIVKAAKRLGVSPETARDLILSGKAGAGVLGGAVIGADALTNYQGQ